MSNRDDFLGKTRRALALRASYLCSLPECRKMTAGPSAESPSAFAVIGRAAHICAAAPGGPRYCASMSPAERCHIDNGIWLCADHAAFVDLDRVTYTADNLRALKQAHEAACGATFLAGRGPVGKAGDLLALGPNLVCVGEVMETGEGVWKLRLNHFVTGDAGVLIDFAEGVMHRTADERYVLANELGTGRELGAALTIVMGPGTYEVSCPVLPKFPRIRAQDLGTDFALSSDGDLYAQSGCIAVVSGVDAFPQRIRTCLSLAQGESPFHQGFGTRLGEYFEDFQNSPWLERLIKLEVVRQAAIPYHDPIQQSGYTPLKCVERVYEVEVLAEAPANNRIPVRLDPRPHSFSHGAGGAGARSRHQGLLECRPHRAAIIERQPGLRIQAGGSVVALGQLVQRGPGVLFPVIRALGRVLGWQHRVRRHAGGL
jgi:hypothetical protein